MPIDARDIETARKIINDPNTKWQAIEEDQEPLTTAEKNDYINTWNAQHPQ